MDDHTKRRTLLRRAGWTAVFLAMPLVAVLAVTLVMTTGGGIVDPWAALAATKGEADVLVLGSSAAHSTVMPMEMWRTAGITAIDVTSGGQSIPVTTAYYQQALETQRPKVVMLEIRMVGGQNALKDLRRAHANLDRMPRGTPWLTAVVENVPSGAWGEFLFPIRNLRLGDFVPDRARFAYARGALYLPVTKSVDASEYRADLPYVRRIARLTREQGTQLVIFAAPTFKPGQVDGTPILERLRSDLASEFPDTLYLDLAAAAREAGVDLKTDYKDASHLNTKGAVKVSRWLADYLTRDLGMPDRRQAPFAARWNADLVKYDNVFKLDW
jgi:lysophospholipase L1-like esterase